MNYFVVIEKGESPRSFGAYVPDLPGCVAVGSTREQVRARIRSAIAMHLEGMLEDGAQPPKPSAPEFVAVTQLASATPNAFRVELMSARAKQLLTEATTREPIVPRRKAPVKKTTAARGKFTRRNVGEPDKPTRKYLTDRRRTRR